MKRLVVLIVCFMPFLLSAQQVQDEHLVKSIFFGGGSWYIDQRQIDELYEFIDSFENLENYEITVHSFTDNIGGKEYNEWLSEMRSQSVLELLLLKDIPMEQIVVKDFGLVNPIYSNDSWSGKRMNRRVDVILWPISM